MPTSRRETAAAARAFCLGVIDVVAGVVAAVKPQMAFFEALGSEGFAALEDVCAYARQAGLLVILDGKRGDIGSTADVAVVVDGPFGSVTREGNEEANDVDLLFPVGSGRYDLLITEETASSGERYYYDLLATVQKEPFEVDREDPSTNTTASSALVLQSGERVLGFLDDLATGEDWYVVDVPPGRHLVTIDVQGFAEGSPADTSVWLYDASLDSLPEGCRMQCEISDGAQPGERDPYFEYDSGGNEAVYVRIRDTMGRTGAAYWYVLRVDVEG